MDEIKHLIKAEDNRLLIDKLLANLSKGKGSVLAIYGESSMGKSYFLNEANETCIRQGSIANIMVDCQSPIGSFKVGKLQPMLPFSRAIESLLNSEQTTAEKKFAMNVGMTVLASIPLAGDLFYAVKELGRDWRQFKKDKDKFKKWQVSSATQDYHDAILSYADKKPLVLMMDDMQYSDAQSIELLRMFAEEIESIPLMIIFSYKKSALESIISPLLTFLQSYDNSENFHQIELQPFSKSDIRDITRKHFKNYKVNDKFEEWMYDHSFGVPGVIIEYLKYFKKNTPFNSDGSLKTSFDAADYLPTTIHSAFSQILEKMSEDDKNILSLCSAEGKEFSALIAAELMNTDILTAIKKLRKIQNETSIIVSQGPRRRYGVKTTTYKFTQAFYNSFFENALEYEEHLALHGKIASILKQKFNDASNDAIREEIAPYLAAHCAETGDNETAKDMLLITAETAQKHGNMDVVKNAYDSYKAINALSGQNEEEDFSPLNIAFKNILSQNENVLPINGETQNGNSVNRDNDLVDNIAFDAVRNSIVMDYHNGKYSLSAEKAITYLNSNEQNLDSISKVQLLMLAIKSFIDTGDLQSAKVNTNKIEQIAKDEENPIIDCLVNNIAGVFASSDNRKDEAMEYLQNAAKKAINLPSELRLLTLSNIGLVIQENDPERAEKFFKAVGKLSKKLNYIEFGENVSKKASLIRKSKMNESIQ